MPLTFGEGDEGTYRTVYSLPEFWSYLGCAQTSAYIQRGKDRAFLSHLASPKQGGCLPLDRTLPSPCLLELSLKSYLTKTNRENQKKSDALNILQVSRLGFENQLPTSGERFISRLWYHSWFFSPQ